MKSAHNNLSLFVYTVTINSELSMIYYQCQEGQAPVL